MKSNLNELLDLYPGIFNKEFRFWHVKVCKAIGFTEFSRIFDGVMVLDLPDHIASRKIGYQLKLRLEEDIIEGKR